jgi:hypothetical protein
MRKGFDACYTQKLSRKSKDYNNQIPVDENIVDLAQLVTPVTI